MAQQLDFSYAGIQSPAFPSVYRQSQKQPRDLAHLPKTDHSQYSANEASSLHRNKY